VLLLKIKNLSLKYRLPLRTETSVASLNLVPWNPHSFSANLRTSDPELGLHHTQPARKNFIFYIHYSTLLHLSPLRFHCARMLGSNPGMLRLSHRQPDSLTTRLERSTCSNLCIRFYSISKSGPVFMELKYQEKLSVTNAL
jgi:hypothetical protein